MYSPCWKKWIHHAGTNGDCIIYKYMYINIYALIPKKETPASMKTLQIV